MVEALAAGPCPVEKLDGAVDRRPLLVTGDQEPQWSLLKSGRSAMKRSAAAIMQAIPPFMSTAPRP